MKSNTIYVIGIIIFLVVVAPFHVFIPNDEQTQINTEELSEIGHEMNLVLENVDFASFVTSPNFFFEYMFMNDEIPAFVRKAIDYFEGISPERSGYARFFGWGHGKYLRDSTTAIPFIWALYSITDGTLIFEFDGVASDFVTFPDVMLLGEDSSIEMELSCNEKACVIYISKDWTNRYCQSFGTCDYSSVFEEKLEILNNLDFFEDVVIVEHVDVRR